MAMVPQRAFGREIERDRPPYVATARARFFRLPEARPSSPFARLERSITARGAMPATLGRATTTNKRYGANC
jgi:hypothetical protein